MLRSFLFFLKLSSFWLIFFTLYRLTFLLIYMDKVPEGKFSEALLAFVYSIRLDASAIAYLITIPLILWAVQQFVKKNFLNRIHHFYNLGMIAVVAVACISGIALYGEWESLLNYNTLYYLVAPAKVFPYLNTLQLIGAMAGVAVVIAIFVLLFRVMILMVLPYSTGKLIHKIIIIPALYPAVFVIARGGIQETPINETFACYSENNFFNHVSINPVWHLGHTLLAMKEEEQQLQP